jgi:hypothetical protein
LEEIKDSVQLAIYALAAREGLFYCPVPSLDIDYDPWTKFAIREPRIRVRCVTKATPPDIWPTDPTRGVFTFSPEALEATKNALLTEAHMLRAARKANFQPWQLPGEQCHKYGRDCDHLPKCKAQDYTVGGSSLWNATDPGYEVARLLGWSQASPDFIVLSQSAYQTSTRCKELVRRNYIEGTGTEESLELEIGKAFHSAIAAVNSQLTSPR